MTEEPSKEPEAPTEPSLPVAERMTVRSGPRVYVPRPDELAPLFPALEVIELIGQGGMGLVYKARQVSLDRLVALKLLPREAVEQPGFSDRFTREARTMARLSHPRIVTVHDSGEVDGLYHLIMEFVEGSNLRALMTQGPVASDQAVAVAQQVCEALAYAHEEGVVHRDIKPENILLSHDGRVKIADFGLAKLLDRRRTDVALTATQQVMGTPHYMSPEQTERPLEVDHRADLYAVGVLLYELLTGELPIGRFPLPSERIASDVRLDEIVLRLLQKDPGRRYQTAEEVTTALSGVVETDPARIVPPDPGSERPIVARRAGSSSVIVAKSLSSTLGTTEVQTPAPSSSGTSLDGRPVSIEAAAREVARPAACLGVSAVLSILLHGAGVIVFLILLFAGTASSGLMLGLSIASGSSMLVAIIILVGVQRMKRLESRWFVILACLAAVLPLVPALWIVLLGPCGLWALLRVLREDVAAGFRLRKKTLRGG